MYRQFIKKKVSKASAFTKTSGRHLWKTVTTSRAMNAVQRNEPEEAYTWDVNESEGVQSSRCAKCEQCVCIEKRRKWFVFVLFPAARRKWDATIVARLVVTVFQRWRPVVFLFTMETVTSLRGNTGVFTWSKTKHKYSNWHKTKQEYSNGCYCILAFTRAFCSYCTNDYHCSPKRHTFEIRYVVT